MIKRILIHGSYLGHTGYANHTRNFANSLNKLIPTRVRNFAYTSDLSYLIQDEKDIVIEQIWNQAPWKVGTPYQFDPMGDNETLNIVLLEVNHFWFWQEYKGPKIAYTVWESTRYPDNFFKRLLEFDQLWVPTEWQRKISIEQGYPSDRVFVVPEGVDGRIFFPNPDLREETDTFKFLVVGRWDYRKSITEIIKAYLNCSNNMFGSELILCVDNPFSVDGMKTTEERFTHHFGKIPSNVHIKHFLSQEELVKLYQSCDCFVSCSRAEGWNLPLCEAIACGAIVICSDHESQSFAHNTPFIVKTKEKKKPINVFNIPDCSGEWNEPDFKHLEDIIKIIYNEQPFWPRVEPRQRWNPRQKAGDLQTGIIERCQMSINIIETYSWKNAAKTAYELILKFENKPWKHHVSSDGSTFYFTPDRDTTVTCKIIDGYSGLNYYVSVMDVKENIQYFVKHDYAGRVKHKLFQVIDLNDEILLSVNNADGEYDFELNDKESILKNYKNIPKDEKTLALPLYEIFIDDIYNHKFCSVQPGDVVFDVGANIGLFSIYSYYKGCKKCYSFEPISKFYNIIKNNLGNILNIIPNNFAVSNETGVALFYVPKNESIGASLYDTYEKYHKEQDIIECSKKAFMEFIKENDISKIDYLKLDCEGEEYNIISSIPDDFLRTSIRKIAIEFHNNKGELIFLLDKLKRCGFEYEFRNGSFIENDFGMVYAWKVFNYELFISKYKDAIKKTGESRYLFYNTIIPLLVSKSKPLYVLETGTMWSGLDDNMGAFTLIMGDLIKNYTGGKLVTVDISQENINKCKNITKDYSDNIEYICSDSIYYLNNLSDEEVSQFDLIYFDSYDLNLTNPEPSSKHHLDELKAVYDRIADDIILAVDDNYLPNTKVEWIWFNDDGSVKSKEFVETGSKLIGKGTHIDQFLKIREWKRIGFEIPGGNSLLCYKRYNNRILRENINVNNILNNFYLKQNSTKPRIKPFNTKAICSDCKGLGDTIILTSFTKDKLVDSVAMCFSDLMLYNEFFTSPELFGKVQYTDIKEFSKYNWNGGHVIQRIAKALGLPNITKPKGYIKKEKNPISNKIGYHFDREKNNHTLSDENIKVFKEFIKNNKQYSFIDLGEIKNLRSLISEMATCSFFIGINSGPMHIAAALEIPSIIIVNSPDADQLYLPKLTECDIPETDWLYPQNVHLHTKGSNELVEKFNLVNLKRALAGNVYPYFSDSYLNISFKPIYNFNINFINGPFVEIFGNDFAEYKIEFIDKDSNIIEYSTKSYINTWHKASKQYYVDWKINVYRNEQLVFTHDIDLKNKRVYIAFESRSIGDTIAWIPYVSEFKTYFECEEVIVSTFHNWLFESEYKDLIFVEPGTIIKNIYAEYKIGCFDENRNLNKVDWRTRPLQQVAADILGITFKEIKTRIKNFSSDRQIKEKYICMSEHSTAGCKYWLRENGWKSVVDYLIKEKNYKVVVISKEKTFLNNIIDRTNNTLEETIKTLKYCDFYIGVGSGPAWISWAMGIPTIVISGFSKPFHEFVSNTERVINTYVCHGCFNDEKYKFDRGDWYWCPLYKGTDRHFECSKKITVEMIIEAINRTTDKIK